MIGNLRLVNSWVEDYNYHSRLLPHRWTAASPKKDPCLRANPELTHYVDNHHRYSTIISI